MSHQHLTHCCDCACFNLRKATRAVTQLYDDAMRPAGLRGTQFSLLVATRLAGPVTVTQLAELAVMDRTTLSRNLEVLEKQGLIHIAPGADRRQKVVSLTGAGEQALETAYPLWQQAQERVIAALGEERWRALSNGLARMVDIAQAG